MTTFTTHVEAELSSQPAVWRQAAGLAERLAASLPRTGTLAIAGSGTSWFMAMSAAILREQATGQRSDAFAASEYPLHRDYDHVLVISRSGTTTEAIDLLNRLRGRAATTLITAVPDSPAAAVADHVVGMPFADETSVVQTRFATATLALFRAHLGADVEALARQAEEALAIDISAYLAADQCTFLGRGWSIGMAHEAALKTREAAQFWAEAYPAMDYRHGPISIAQPGRLVWSFGEVPPGLDADVAATGATWVHHDLDPLAAVVVAQRFAVGMSKKRGLNPDQPRSLTRAVIL